MSERRQLIAVVFATVLIAMVGFGIFYLLNADAYVADLTADYTARITIDEELTLVESYTYHVMASKFRMLYRFWDAPLFVSKISQHSSPSLDIPHILLVDVDADGIAYVKDYFGKVVVWENDIRAMKLAEDLAERNEVGFIRLPNFEVGDYKAEYRFVVYPPIECDGELDHINLKLADRHVPYPNVRIIVKDPNDAVVKLYPHLTSYEIRKEGDTWIIEGRSPADSLVEVEMLLKAGIVDGYVADVDDVKGITESANMQYYFVKNAVEALKYVALALVLGFPIVVVCIYNRYGKEKDFVVPEFLSFVPKKRKPWIVNLVFNGDAFVFDENGFYATLLDLQRRGFIEIEPYEEKGRLRSRRELRIKILKLGGDDKYERTVLEFLRRFSKGRVFDTRRLRAIVKKDSVVAEEVASWLDTVMKYRDPHLSKDFVDRTGKKIFGRITLLAFIAGIVGVFLVLPILNLHPTAISNPILFFTLSAQAFACYLAPSQLFGRWKDDFYKEKLEWEAFKRFLSDLAMIKKYAPEDISIWKEWLVYGTALGVGERVVEAMKSLNIKIPESTTFYGFTTFHGIRTSAVKASSSGVGGFGGGGFGAGGGFGGGGAGGR
jgi:uncharacterized membrane protein